MMTEFVTTDTDTFYCDHDPDCLEKIKLPVLVADMMRGDNTLILLIGKHTSSKAGKVAAKGKGWKICKVVK